VKDRIFQWAWRRAVAGRPGALTRVFWLWIPFNKPHRFRIGSLAEGAASVEAPPRRWNRNHLGTVHACALATIGEFAAGLALLGAFDPSAYRLIMSRLEVDYTRRAKGRILAAAAVELDALRAGLAASGVALSVVESELRDGEGEVVARVRTQWQVKSWSQASR
jgi:acyl-coenzyme A thioesterase PaaI-like protein